MSSHKERAMKKRQSIRVLIFLALALGTGWAQSDSGQRPADNSQQPGTAPAPAFGQDNPPPQANDNPPLLVLPKILHPRQPFWCPVSTHTTQNRSHFLEHRPYWQETIFLILSNDASALNDGLEADYGWALVQAPYLFPISMMLKLKNGCHGPIHRRSFCVCRR